MIFKMENGSFFNFSQNFLIFIDHIIFWLKISSKKHLIYNNKKYVVKYLAALIFNLELIHSYIVSLGPYTFDNDHQLFDEY